jgi:2'-5' RNA ligase
VRCFVAVWPPPAVLDTLERVERPVLQAGRWTHRNTWHLTLRFVGEVGDEDAGRLIAAARRAAASCAVPVAELGPVTALLNPGVLVAPVAGLDAVATAVIRATAAIGTPPGPRPFAGRITLARARGRGRLPRDVAGRAVGARWAVEELAVVRSHLGDDRARYERLAAVAVGGPVS